MNLQIIQYVRAFFPGVYASRFFPWKDFPPVVSPVKLKFSWIDWLWGHIKPKPFPYKNILDVNESSNRFVKNVLVYELHRLADQAFWCRDYKAHAIYSMAANRLTHLHVLEHLYLLEHSKKH